MTTEKHAPNARAKGRGRTKLGETGQSATPRPLERRVGRRTRKEWLLLFAFRSWLFSIRPTVSCGLERSLGFFYLCLVVGRNAKRRVRPDCPAAKARNRVSQYASAPTQADANLATSSTPRHAGKGLLFCRAIPTRARTAASEGQGRWRYRRTNKKTGQSEPV